MFTFEQYCYDALKLFDRYSVNNQNVLIGHSYGTRLVDLCRLVVILWRVHIKTCLPFISYSVFFS